MTESGPQRPGEVLRARREALDVTVREVAETLNLSITVIEAIEADDAARLPGTVFARGYVRAYARLLELDPKPLLEYYPKAEAAEAPGEVPSEPPIWEWIRRRPGLVLGSAGGVVVTLLVLILLLLWPDGGADVDGNVAAEGADGAATDLFARRSSARNDPGREEWPAPPEPAPDGPAAGLPAAGQGAAAAPTAGVPALESQAGEPPVADGPADPEPETLLAGAGFEADAGPLEAQDQAQRITAGGDDRLAFGFSDDCWVEVKSASGANLYSDLNRAGSELELVGQGPFRILLGYAPGARLTFNGEPVPLAPHTRNNVATLVLGQ